MTETAKPPKSRFSDQSYAVPFGRYEGNSPAEPPANEVLVGREKQRAQFLRILFNLGRRGAYLITGQRGSGKSTFARYCLEHYKDNVYRRHLKTNVGRAFFWDRVGNAILVGLLPLLAGLLSAQMVQEFEQIGDPNLFEWLLILPVTLITLYPFLAAAKLAGLFARGVGNNQITQAGQTSKDDKKSHSVTKESHPDIHRRTLTTFLETTNHCKKLLRQAAKNFTLERVRRPARRIAITMPNPFIGLVAITIALTFWLRMPLQESYFALSQLVLLVSWAYFVCVLYSFRTFREGHELWSEDLSYTILPTTGPTRFTPLILILSASALILFAPTWALPSEPKVTFLTYLIAAIGFLAFGALTRSFDQLRLRKTLSRHKDINEPEKSRRLRALLSACRWNQGSFALLFAIYTAATLTHPDSLLKYVSYIPLAACTLTASLSRLWATKTVTKKLKQREDNKQPKPEEAPFRCFPRVLPLLMLKSFSLLILGLQLAHPTITLLRGQLNKIFQSILPENTTGIIADLHTTIGILSSPDSLGQRFHSGAPLFTNASDDILWLATALLLFLLIGMLEFEWIIRPYARTRDDIARHRPTENQEPTLYESLTQEKRLLFKEISEQTFFSKIYANWLPVLTIPVNLGFDILEYRRVIEAMLAGLREAYKRKFLHWSSPFYVARRVLVWSILATLALTLGDHWFQPENIQANSSRLDICKQNEKQPPPLFTLCKFKNGALADFAHWTPLRPYVRTTTGTEQRNTSTLLQRALEIDPSLFAQEI